MQIWSAEILQLSELYNSLKGHFPDLEKELEPLIRTIDANVMLLYSRRSLEVIISDLCECELKRPRKTEPLKGIIDKLNKEEKVPSHIITSMHSLNDLSNYGAHPKDYDPEQVKPVLINLSIIIKWYVKYKEYPIIEKLNSEGKKSESKQTGVSKTISGNTKRKLLIPIIIVLVSATAVITFVNLAKLEKSIAVLPFKFDSPDVNEENSAFINGLMEEILINLQMIKVLRVISRTSVEQFRGPEKPTIPEIAKKLGVNYIVEGSVQKYGNIFHLRVQLIRADKESHLWAKSYEQEISKVSDIFRIQSQIAEAIASELKAEITPQEKQQIEKTPTDNPEAYRLYTVGNFFMSRWGEDNFRKAIDNYKQAIALDSNFAQAHANLASAYFELTMWDVPEPDPEYIPLAMNSALKALEINKDLGEPYFVIGSIKYMHELDFVGAEEAFKKGMQFNPNYVWGRINYANFLTLMGRLEESIGISRHSVKLNPLDPATYIELAYPLAQIGQDKEALELYNKSLELKPNSWNAIGCLTEFYSNKGIYNKFLSDQIDTLMGSPRNEISKISSSNLNSAGKIYAKVGQREEALAILDELNRRADAGEQISQMARGFICNGLGEYEKAIDFFEKGFNEKESWLEILDQCQDDSIRSNKRFIELIRKMGFTKL
jgi:TolB-like protein